MGKSEENAREAWSALLASHRRAWPSWSELERRVRERAFVIHSIGPLRYLFATGTGEAPLSRRIASRGAPIPEIADPFPAWVSALIGVDCVDAGNLSSAGMLVGDLWPPGKLRSLTAMKDWEHGDIVDSSNEHVASGLFILQRNRSGTPIFSDGASVLRFAPESCTFEPVAALEVFLELCLEQCLAGNDWYEAWARGAGKQRGIRPPPG
jgi:hypothetical protein